VRQCSGGKLSCRGAFRRELVSSEPIARSRPSDVPLNQWINIRIHTDQKWPERVVFDTSRRRWHRLKTRRAKARLVKSLWQPSGMTQSRRSQKRDVRLSKAVGGRPVRPTTIRNRTLHGSARPLSSGITQDYRGRQRPSPPPIRFTSCQEKVDAFPHETGHFLSKMFCVLPHQSSHQHW
jgi:hypothetical protein